MNIPDDAKTIVDIDRLIELFQAAKREGATYAVFVDNVEGYHWMPVEVHRIMPGGSAGPVLELGIFKP
jgi:hypothetical protein